MCGITGFLGGSWQTQDVMSDVARRMTAEIVHRGPDGAGQWIDAEAGVALAHRRLAILDLSPSGSQPMISTSGRYVMVYNGEIYNHEEIRCLLPGVPWRGRSDTEVLLAGIEAWGLELAISRSVGMFALALWDRKHRTLTLARDRFGEKPLYYGWQGSSFIFASELKALWSHPEFTGSINRDSLRLFVCRGYIPAPHSIYTGIRKLPPGALIEVKPGVRGAEPRTYWSLETVAAAGINNPFRGSESEAVLELEKILADAVRKQMIADVPLGAFLSGGIDSSIVVALMQQVSKIPVRTFTIGFEDERYDESESALAVATRLGTEHRELRITETEAMKIIPSLASIYDEPFGDSSAIPTILLSRLARKHVTVSLSGDGGDELFGGYRRYTREPSHWRRLETWPLILRKASAQAAQKAVGALRKLEHLNMKKNHAGTWRNASGRLQNQFRSFAASGGAKDFREFYLARLSQWMLTEPIVEGVGKSSPEKSIGDASSVDPLGLMMTHDAITFLPDDVLCKVDRAAMAVSLESRCPLLDHRVAEFAATLPMNLKIRNGMGKWALRQVLHRHLPSDLVERPKKGFGVPIGTWLRGPLREWGEDTLAEPRLRRQGFLNPSLIRERWRQHQLGIADWQHSLWTALMFQTWLDGHKSPDHRSNRA